MIVSAATGKSENLPLEVSTERFLRKVVDITEMAGLSIMDFYRDEFSVTDKTPDNPVTDADLAADRLLRSHLTSLLPESGWLSEETVDNPERLRRQLCWIVDPLDGTKEFVAGIPEFVVSVALVQDGRPILAVIYNPPTGEMFYARRGGGVILSGQNVEASRRNKITGARVDASRSERLRGEFEAFERIVQLTTMGSIAYKLARVASGQSDATWSRGPKNEWDICAGVLLIQESGGQCTDLDGSAFSFNKPYPKVNGIIASNDRLFSKIVDLLAPHRHTARID